MKLVRGSFRFAGQEPVRLEMRGQSDPAAELELEVAEGAELKSRRTLEPTERAVLERGCQAWCPTCVAGRGLSD